MTTKAKYCIDTCCLVDMARRDYPMDIFPGLWELFEKEIQDGVIVSPTAVFEELQTEHERDVLLPWAKKRKSMFLGRTPTQEAFMKIFMSKFNHCMPAGSKSWADPWLVAVSNEQGLIVVTSELEATVNPGTKKLKVPNFCKEYSVTCIGLVEMFRQLGWKV